MNSYEKTQLEQAKKNATEFIKEQKTINEHLQNQINSLTQWVGVQDKLIRDMYQELKLYKEVSIFNTFKAKLD